MPHVNGKYYRSAGQGYAAEKSKMGSGMAEHDEAHEPDGDEGQGPIVHVKHLGGGKFQTKSQHHDGHTTSEHHDSPEAMHEHLSKHFGLDEAEPEADNEYDSGEESEDSLKSLLG